MGCQSHRKLCICECLIFLGGWFYFFSLFETISFNYFTFCPPQRISGSAHGVMCSGAFLAQYEKYTPWTYKSDQNEKKTHYFHFRLILLNLPTTIKHQRLHYCCIWLKRKTLCPCHFPVGLLTKSYVAVSPASAVIFVDKTNSIKRGRSALFFCY